MSEWDATTAEWYAEKYGEYATNRLAIDALADLDPTNVLDIGCGTGAALRHASRRWPSARFVGVDPVSRMVEIARERLEKHPGESAIELRVGSAENLPAGDDAFDLILAFDSFDHWRDTRAGAREAARVLAPGGRLVVVRDQGVPGHSDDVVKRFRTEAGLELVASQRIDADGVSFAMWVFMAR